MQKIDNQNFRINHRQGLLSDSFQVVAFYRERESERESFLSQGNAKNKNKTIVPPT